MYNSFKRIKGPYQFLKMNKVYEQEIYKNTNGQPTWETTLLTKEILFS